VISANRTRLPDLRPGAERWSFADRMLPPPNPLLFRSSRIKVPIAARTRRVHSFRGLTRHPCGDQAWCTAVDATVAGDYPSPRVCSVALVWL
jgi:hypothetical protein